MPGTGHSVKPLRRAVLPSPGDEISVVQQCHAGPGRDAQGPDGLRQDTLRRAHGLAAGRPLITVSCHDDLTASDLIGRFLMRHDDTVWQDGPLTRAVREGAICYLDEVVEARQDTIVVLHPLTDYRRFLPIDRTGETLRGGAGLPVDDFLQSRLSAHAQGPEAEHAPTLRRDRARVSAAGAGSRDRGAREWCGRGKQWRWSPWRTGCAPCATAASPRYPARAC
jgi:hypothetical protein